MNGIRTRIVVGPDRSITGIAPEELPPGEHEVMITVAPAYPGKPFTGEHLPGHNLGWDSSVSLRREDMYGDDGR